MISAFRAQDAGQVSWVISGSPKRAEEFAQSHEIDHSSSQIADALNDSTVDAVYISSTNEKHCEQALGAIAASKNVLCEKPLATTTSDAIKMVNAAEAAGVVFATNHHLRCAGSHQAIRSIVQDGRIGRVLSLRIFHAVHLPEHLRGWRLDNPEAGGGVIPDLTVHNADVVRFILGEDPQSVSAQMCVSGMGQGVEDSAMSVWMMPSGAMVMSHESFTHPFAASGIEVHGSEGSIIATGVLGQEPLGAIKLITKAGCETVPFDNHDLYSESVRRFSEAISTNGRPASTGLDGVKSLLVATAVREAARSGVSQTIDYEVIS